MQWNIWLIYVIIKYELTGNKKARDKSEKQKELQF